MKLAVVILNWNGRKFLKDFLPSVIEHNPDYSEIIVADNASTDDSVEFLKKNYPNVRIIINESNGGFSKGYNDALKQIDAEYYCLLNSDIKVSSDWIDPILELMDSDENIAVCQPKLLSYFEPKKFEYAGAAGGFIDKYGYPFCRGRIFSEIETDHGQYNDVCEIFWATGACMFVKADVYHKFGGLDEDFFAHMEEIDFCWRLKNHGYKIMYCPDSKVYHIGGGTLPKKSAQKTYLNFRNNIILLYKNLPSHRLFHVFILRFFFDIAAAFRFLFDSGFDDFWAVFKAHIDFHKSHRRNLSKRHKINHKKVSKMYQKSIVVNHYLKNIKKFSQIDPSDFS